MFSIKLNRKIKSSPASPDEVSLPTATASSSVLNLTTHEDQNINPSYQLQHISFDVSKKSSTIYRKKVSETSVQITEN